MVLLQNTQLAEQSETVIEMFEPLDPVWSEIAHFELPKIAMRSMEHGSHPGRFLNDFRKQFSGSPVVYSTMLGYGPPGRIFAELLSLFVFERLIFGSYYANVEKPFIHFPLRPEDEPQDFMPGAQQMERLLPHIAYLADEISRFFHNIHASFEDIALWREALRNIESRCLSLVAESPQFEIPTKVFDDTALIKYRPEDVILEFRQLERFVKMLLYAVREDAIADDDKSELMALVLSVLSAYREALDSKWGDILYQNRSTGVRQDMRPNAVKRVYSACSLLHSEINAVLTGGILPDIPETPEEPAAGQTMDIDLFREMVAYSVDAEAFVASKALAHEIALDRVQFAKRLTAKKELNLTEIIRSLPDQIKPEGAERMDVIVPEDVDIFIHGSERRIRGLLTNLITNSFQFGKHVRIRLEYDPLSQRALVRVSDNGKGIHPDLLVWDATTRRVTLFNLGATRRRVDLGTGTGGTGVGATESFWQAEMHGGTLTLEETVRAPNPAQGTTFLAALPAEARELWRRYSIEEFLRLVSDRYAPEVREATGRALRTLRERSLRLVEERGLILRENGDILNRGHLEYVTAVSVSQLLFNESGKTIEAVLRDYLLPLETDRIDPRMFRSSSAAARRSVILLRLMARVGSMPVRRRERLLTCLEECEQKTRDLTPSLAPLTPLLRASITQNLSGRQHLALARAIEEQKRTYLATESLDHLYREVQRLCNTIRGVFIHRPRGARLQQMLQAKAQALVDAIQKLLQKESGSEPNMTPELLREQQMQERAHLLDFVRRALVQPVGERLTDFPIDWRSLIVYLAEHEAMARVLEELPQADIASWLEAMDQTLPLVASFLDPHISGDAYERLIDDPATPVYARLMLRSDLPQIAMLTNLHRIREIHQFLVERGVSPKPRGPDSMRPILLRVVEATNGLCLPADETVDVSDSSREQFLDSVMSADPTTQPTDWKQWLTYLVKLHTSAVLSRVAVMTDEELRLLCAVVNAGMVMSRCIVESGLFDHLLEHYDRWQTTLGIEPERFDYFVAQVTQIHAQTALPQMEESLGFALSVANHWMQRTREDAERSLPQVSGEILTAGAREMEHQHWFAHLPEPLREQVTQLAKAPA